MFQKISHISAFSSKLLKTIFFSLLSLFFIIAGIVNLTIILAFSAPDTSPYYTRDLGYLIAFTIFYIAFIALSIFLTIRSIKQLKRAAQTPPEPIIVHQGIKRWLYSWPMIAIVGLITAFVVFMATAVLAGVTEGFLENKQDMFSVITYLIITGATIVISAGCIVVTVGMIIQRIKQRKLRFQKN